MKFYTLPNTVQSDQPRMRTTDGTYLLPYLKSSLTKVAANQIYSVFTLKFMIWLTTGIRQMVLKS